MSSNYDYDLIIIGAGPGGYVTAEHAGKLGLKTAIVEKGTWGGVCLNVGCIPTKTLLKNAKIYHYLTTLTKYGINIKTSDVTIDWEVAQKRKADVVKQLTSGVQFLMKSNKIDMLIGTAQAVDYHTIEVINKDGTLKKYTTNYFIIATGSEVRMFDSVNGPQGLSTAALKTNPHLLTSTEILDLKTIPESLTIIGGGVIGVEFACLFSAFKTKVTIIEYLDRILALLDNDISAEMTAILKANNVEIITNHSVSSLEGNKLTYYHTADKEKKSPLTITSDYTLLSTGRVPITAGFENIGLKIKTNNAFATSATLNAITAEETELANVFVIGDANGEKMLAHVASKEGLVALNNIMVAKGAPGYVLQKMDYQQMPNCVYTFPEIAAVGRTEPEALAYVKAKYGTAATCLVSKKWLRFNGKALAEGETAGFVKLIVDAKYGEILGAHILAPTATDMIAEIVNVMVNEVTVTELASVCHPHPTISEIIMEAAQELALKVKPN